MKTKILSMLKRFRDNESGATLVEYGVAISLATILGVTALAALSDDIANAMDAAGEQMCESGKNCGGGN